MKKKVKGKIYLRFYFDYEYDDDDLSKLLSSFSVFQSMVGVPQS
jgi:hypothetical protein